MIYHILLKIVFVEQVALLHHICKVQSLRLQVLVSTVINLRVP